MSDDGPKRDETLGGYILHNVPFPRDLNAETLALLKQMAPVQIEQPYSITYLHSYAQDSPFFAGLANKVFLGNRDPETRRIQAWLDSHPKRGQILELLEED